MKVVLEHPFRALKFKVVFGKNSDRPEGEVQDVVEVRAKTLSVFFQTVSTEIFRKKKIFLSQSGFKVKALDHTPGTRLKVFQFLKLEMFNPTADQFLSPVHLHRGGPGWLLLRELDPCGDFGLCARAAIYTIHCTIHCIMVYTVQCTVYSMHCIVFSRLSLFSDSKVLLTHPPTDREQILTFYVQIEESMKDIGN